MHKTLDKDQVEAFESARAFLDSLPIGAVRTEVMKTLFGGEIKSITKEARLDSILTQKQWHNNLTEMFYSATDFAVTFDSLESRFKQLLDSLSGAESDNGSIGLPTFTAFNITLDLESEIKGFEDFKIDQYIERLGDMVTGKGEEAFSSIEARQIHLNFLPTLKLLIENFYNGEISTEDALTQIKNRRGFLHKKEALEQDGKEVIYVFFDLDYFKSINTKYGYDMGDKVLKGITDVVRELVPGDFFARYGGEEFVLIMEGKTQEEVYSIVDGIRRKIEEKNFEADKKKEPLRLTASFGIASSMECAMKAEGEAKEIRNKIVSDRDDGFDLDAE